VRFQAPILGFTKTVIKSLRKAKVLDVACGNGDLVRYLRRKGIDAEGIDPAAPANSTHFMSKLILESGERKGIPRPPRSYDLVVTFQNHPLNSYLGPPSGNNQELVSLINDEAFRDSGAHEMFVKDCMAAQNMIHEMIRVVKPEGKIVIWPELSRIEEVMGFNLKMEGVAVSRQSIAELSDINAYVEWENPGIEPVREGGLLTCATILQIRE
jgi:SAM-dependent methyltransferase